MKSHSLLPAVLMAITAVTATLQPVSAQTDVNILSNGSFERFVWSSGVPDNWVKLSSYGTISVIAATPSFPSPNAGDFILQLNDSSSSTSTSIISDPVMATAAASYTVEGYIQRASTSATPNLYIKFYNSSGTEIGSFSSSSVSGVNVWEYVSLTAAAPSGTVTAKVICYSSTTSTGLSWFDGVSLRRNGTGTAPLLRYVSSNGTGTGITYGSPAYYNSPTFWSGVQSSLGSQPVKVMFLSGQYVIDPTNSQLFLYSKGNATYRLTLEGEHPFGSVFTRDDNAPDDSTGSLEMVILGICQNVTVRHLHWENQITLATKLTGYGLYIYSDTTGTECQNILVEGCSFVGLDKHYYGGLGINGPQTHDVEVRYCEFVRGGYDVHYHMIYNFGAAYNLTFDNDYYQDCSGAYLRLRAGCHDTHVTSNHFVSTAATSGNYNVHFVEIADFNTTTAGTEMWGYNHTIEFNNFYYVVSAANNVAIHLTHSGYDPTVNGMTWQYLLTTQDATTLNGTNAAAESAILTGHFGIVVPGGNGSLALFIDNNTRVGFHTYNVQLESRADYGSINLGGDGAYDISEVFPND